MLFEEDPLVGDVLIDQQQSKPVGGDDEAVVELSERMDLAWGQRQILCNPEL